MAERQVTVLQVDKLGSIQEQEDGRVAVTFLYGEDGEFGFMLPPSAVSELAGALISREHSLMDAGSEASEREFDRHVHVTTIEAVPAGEEKFSLRIAQENGPGLTFHMGHRQVRRWRDMLTDQIVRHERKKAQ